MPVTHSKVSGISDGADTTQVRPSDWNANHTITGYVADTDFQLQTDQAELRIENDVSIPGNGELMWANTGDVFLQGQYAPDLVTIPNGYYRLHYLEYILNNDLTMEGTAELVLFDFLPHGDLTLA